MVTAMAILHIKCHLIFSDSNVRDGEMEKQMVKYSDESLSGEISNKLTTDNLPVKKIKSKVLIVISYHPTYHFWAQRGIFKLQNNIIVRMFCMKTLAVIFL